MSEPFSQWEYLLISLLELAICSQKTCMKSAPSRISPSPSGTPKSATSSKRKSEVWGQADRNCLSIVSLGMWGKMSTLLLLILMAIGFLLRSSIILIRSVSPLLIYGHLYYFAFYSCKKQQCILSVKALNPQQEFGI